MDDIMSKKDVKYIELREVMSVLSEKDAKKRKDDLEKLKKKYKTTKIMTPTVQKRLKYIDKLAEMMQ
jgi:hypothetical protein